MARVVAVVAAAPAARGGLPAAHAPPLVAVFALYPGLLGVGVDVGGGVFVVGVGVGVGGGGGDGGARGEAAARDGWLGQGGARS